MWLMEGARLTSAQNLQTSPLSPHGYCLYCLCVLRKGQLSHPLPDFSKIEPRIRFPKSSYKPPKSWRPPHKEDSRPEAPVVFKSPADIVREALLSNSEGPLDTSSPTDSWKPWNSPVPEELRCPLQASTIVQQLQVWQRKLNLQLKFCLSDEDICILINRVCRYRKSIKNSWQREAQKS